MSTPPPSNEWLPYARRDWSRSLLLLREHDPDGSGMFLQQAVEKYLKGWLLDHGWSLRKLHHVHRLIDDAAVYDASLLAYRPLGVRLSSYYVLDRYPPLSLQGPSDTQITADLVEARQLIVILFPGEQI